MDLATLKRFEAALQIVYPDLSVKFKDQSWTQKLLGLLMAFNPAYMTDYITTFGSTIYFPSQAYYEANPEASLNTVAHEFVHVYDSKRTLWFKLSYLFPQVLVLIPAIVYCALVGRYSWVLTIPAIGYFASCLLFKYSKMAFGAILGLSFMTFLALGWLYTGWHMLILLGLLALAPWPAPWRVQWELRGYGMNLAVTQWMYKSVPTAEREFQISLFTGPAYFYMSWDQAAVEKNLEATRQQAAAGVLQTIAPYSTVYDFLSSNMLVARE
jgi:hypothetical protein